MGKMIHPTSEVLSTEIGEGTIVWQFSVILAGAIIGNNCNINCHTFIENKVHIGNNVTIKSGVYIWDGTEIESNVFIGPNVTFINDNNPRSKKHLTDHPITTIQYGASIGAASIIHSGISIGKFALIGAGSNVTKDVPAYSMVWGNPAKIHGWVDENGNKLIPVSKDKFEDLNGNLYVLENNILKIQ